MDKPRAIDPVIITTTDGQGRKALLTRGALRRIKSQLGVKTLQELLVKVANDEDGAQGIFLYECMLEKVGLSLDQFEDILPVSLEADMAQIMQIIGASMPEREGRPPDPPATIQ